MDAQDALAALTTAYTGTINALAAEVIHDVTTDAAIPRAQTADALADAIHDAACDHLTDSEAALRVLLASERPPQGWASDLEADQMDEWGYLVDEMALNVFVRDLHTEVSARGFAPSPPL